MGSLFKTITMILGVVTVVFGGYYLYLDSSNTNLQDANAEQSLQEMLSNTSVFISHSQELNQINLDLSLFEDQRFQSLRLYSQPIEAQPTGRSNPFSEPN